MKLTTKAVGDRGEEAAVQYLKSQGYCILARNFRIKSGEIDIIATRDNVIAFCEVKSSNYLGEAHPEIRVDRRKQLKLARCANIYILKHKIKAESYRFDVITVKNERGREVVEHLENAFWAPEGWEHTD